MENNARRMDYYIGALRDLFDTLAGFDSWWNLFDTPEDAEMQDMPMMLIDTSWNVMKSTIIREVKAYQQ